MQIETTKIEVKQYIITLTEDEAIKLSTILGSIMGYGKLRKIVDDVYYGLYNKGIRIDSNLQVWDGGVRPKLDTKII